MPPSSHRFFWRIAVCLSLLWTAAACVSVNMVEARLSDASLDTPASDFPPPNDAKRAASIRRGLWTITAVGVLATFVTTWFLTSGATRTLGEIREAADRTAAGGTGLTVTETSGGDALAAAEAFNRMSDALDRRLAEAARRGDALEDASRMLETVLDSMHDGVAAVDQNQKILYANRAALGLFESPRSNVAGRPLLEVARHSRLTDVVERVLRGDGSQQEELEIRRTDAVVELLATPLPGEPVPGVVVVFHNVTELRRLENQRREFFSNVSHELKTPLASIQAYAETLLNGAVDDASHNRAFLRRIDEQAERLHTLILDMLSLTKIEAERDAFDIIDVPVESTIRACVETHRAVAEGRRVRIDVAPPVEPVSVRADVEGLRTIVGNLLANAVSYTPQDGRVTISWQRAGDEVRIDVADTGIGIGRDHLPRIFERFYRVDKARSRDQGGTGLGLSIVKHLAQSFGGGVEVASEPRLGSTFTVTLRHAEK